MIKKVTAFCFKEAKRRLDSRGKSDLTRHLPFICANDIHV